eukprot:7376736-Prymnesium_polylepis.1
MRWRVGAWEELRWRAQAYHGRRWTHGRVAGSRLSREPRLRAHMEAGQATRSERRQRMVDECERQIGKYRAKMAAAEGRVARSDEFVEEMQTAVAQSTMGGVVHAIFE